MRTYRSSDGISWGVEVALPGSSNAMVIFRHPDGRSSRQNRYNWFISSAPEARSVTSRLVPEKVLDSSRMLALGWKPRTSLTDGLKRTYEWYLSQN